MEKTSSANPKVPSGIGKVPSQLSKGMSKQPSKLNYRQYFKGREDELVEYEAQLANREWLEQFQERRDNAFKMID